MRGIMDPLVGVPSRMHAAPERRWTLQALGRGRLFESRLRSDSALVGQELLAI